MRKFLILSASVAAALLPVAADAGMYSFDLTGSRSANFMLESTAPDFSSTYQTQFQNVSGTFDGVAGVASAISFGALPFISSLDISGTSLGFTQFGGPLLFTGPTSNPVFTTGSFMLTGIVSGASTLTITSVDGTGSTVAEPATWALMIGGFGFVGGATRRARATAARA